MEYVSYATTSMSSDLCKKTLQKLGKDKLSEPLRSELKQVNGELAEATKEYFKYKFIVDCVKKFLDQNVEKKVKNKDQAILSDPLYLNIVKEYSTEDGIQPFGITEDFINKTISRKQKTQKEKEELNKFIRDEINNFCVKISEYTGCAQRYRKALPERAFQESVKDLSSEIDSLADAKCKLESDEEEINNLVTNYFENLIEGVLMLKSLISLHEKKLEFHSSLRDLYESRQRTMAAKINRFEHQVLAATYHKKSIEALSLIRAELDERKTSLDNDINSTTSKLQEYLVLGPQYNRLVEEYTELLRQIQNEKWALESLKRRESFGAPLFVKEELINSFDLERSVFEETRDNSTLEGTADSSKLEVTASGSKSEETADGSTLEEMADGSTLEETTDSSKFDETADGSRLEETADGSRLEETVDDSKLEETVDDSKLEETADDSKLEGILFSSTLRESVS